MPGCYKLPWALRDRRLLARINAADAGSLVPPRYQAAWRAGDGDRNADAIATFSTALADRVSPLLEAGTFAVVLGGDCSILVGTTLALKRRGRYGLVFLDAHSDFRHPRNAPAIGAAAGEDLAIVTGRGDARLTSLEHLGPYIRDEDVVLIGIRDNDEYLPELGACGMHIITSTRLTQLGVQQAGTEAVAAVARAPQGFWVHLDLDVVDAAEMPAVDCPEPDGLSFSTLTALLKLVLESPTCAGLELTIYDPDLDPTGYYAEQVVACIADVFGSS